MIFPILFNIFIGLIYEETLLKIPVAIISVNSILT